MADVFLAREQEFEHHATHILQFDRYLSLLGENCLHAPRLAAAVREFEVGPLVLPGTHSQDAGVGMGMEGLHANQGRSDLEGWGGEDDPAEGKTQNIPLWAITDNSMSTGHGEGFSSCSPVPGEKHKASRGPKAMGVSNKWPAAEDPVTASFMDFALLLTGAGRDIFLSVGSSV